MPVLSFKESAPTRDKPLAATPRKPRRKRLPVARRRARKVVEVTHRWVAFALGLALLAVVISGVVLTFGPEIQQWENGSKYDTTETGDPIAPTEALAVVKEERPEFGAQDVVVDDGVYFVYDEDYERQAYVDPGPARSSAPRTRAPASWA
jgi:uncharacterized iron-regulated membrane protein